MIEVNRLNITNFIRDAGLMAFLLFAVFEYMLIVGLDSLNLDLLWNSVLSAIGMLAIVYLMALASSVIKAVRTRADEGNSE